VTTVDHYKPNLRDIFFQLFEVLEVQSNVLGKAPFETMDEETARTALEGFLEVMQASWAPTFADGDGNVRPEFVWAAMDCPGIWALIVAAPRGTTDRVVSAQIAVRRDAPVIAVRRTHKDHISRSSRAVDTS